MTIRQGLKGKLLIEGILTVKTGMHIGGGNDFAAIGAVDSVFVRDILTKEPIIPGSSIKGKLRTLLARTESGGSELKDINCDGEVVKRMFGAAGKGEALPARLQFFDLFITRGIKKVFEGLDTDTYLGEIKSENTIGRGDGVANPRQIERVPAGMQYEFKVIYNVENDEEAKEDLATLSKGIKLLSYDYLGGHGSRGYGRIGFDSLTVSAVDGIGADIDEGDLSEYNALFEGCTNLQV